MRFLAAPLLSLFMLALVAMATYVGYAFGQAQTMIQCLITLTGR